MHAIFYHENVFKTTCSGVKDLKVFLMIVNGLVSNSDDYLHFKL